MKLIWFPYGGGNSYTLQPLENYLKDRFEIVGIEYSGHGRRVGEPLLTSLEDIADDCYEQIRGSFNEPTIFWGHSMGSLIAYLVAHKISQDPSTQNPQALFLSGRYAPSVKKEPKQTHLYPKEKLIEYLENLGGVDSNILKEPLFFDYYEPIIRADFQAINEFTLPKIEQIPIPIVAMMGKGDYFSEDECREWGKFTSHKFELIKYEGDHFFIFKKGLEISNLLKSYLAD